MKQLANFITIIRIIFSLFLFFAIPLTIGFYIIYLICGITDMLDGLVARRLHIETSFGAKLDSIADIVFMLAAIYKIFPIVKLSNQIWFWIGVIALVKLINLIIGYACQKKIIMLHTYANKATGFVLFVLPLTLNIFNINYSAIPVCILATFAAIQEGYLIRKGSLKDKNVLFEKMK